MACLCGESAPSLRTTYHTVRTRDELLSVLNQLDTGDLLLYKSKGVTAWGVRAATQSDWDHVSVVLRRHGGVSRTANYDPTRKMHGLKSCTHDYCECEGLPPEDDELEVIEATAAGVHTYALEERIARRLHHDIYIAVRKLRGLDGSSKETGQKVEKFVEESHGIGYGFLDIPAMARTAVVRRPQRRKSAEDGDEVKLSTAFCSELAVAALMRLDILKGNTAVKSFTPGMLSTEHNFLKDFILPGLSYEDETVLLEPSGFTRREFGKLMTKMRASRSKKTKSQKVVPGCGTRQYLTLASLPAGSSLMQRLTSFSVIDKLSSRKMKPDYL
uniref:Uncharacterized protein n=1 Tax=Mucochytrium quahogii TaxID=96639 RepID=A0A7S2WIW0_9STRA|mmetsp:Transcript_5232/g.9242  ORF Transcript_5232/g.9242 Transcript_5232/m.9242 type:complete len:329 (-) Transcript_5232:763-1749(-)